MKPSIVLNDFLDSRMGNVKVRLEKQLQGLKEGIAPPENARRFKIAMGDSEYYDLMKMVNDFLIEMRATRQPADTHFRWARQPEVFFNGVTYRMRGELVLW